jgi:hypothetical protein
VFTALSYTWGGEENSKHITLNGQCVAVRSNLYDFLVRAIREGWTTNLWIDALCINQEDEAEKSKQVMLMGEIYSRASQVLVWLGVLGEMESESLVRAAKSCRYLNKRYGSVPAGDLFSEMHPADLSTYTISRSDFKSGCRRGLVRVLGNPYWKRKWIIQEVFLSGPNACIVTCDWAQPTIPITELAREIYMFVSVIRVSSRSHDELMQYLIDCSTNDLSLTTPEAKDAHAMLSLARSLGYMDDKGRFDIDNSLASFWESVADAKMTYKSRSLMALVDKYRDHLCANPRDHIYALLGLSTLTPERLIVDYSCKIEQLYEDVWAVVKDDMDGHDQNCLKRALQFGPYYTPKDSYVSACSHA